MTSKASIGYGIAIGFATGFLAEITDVKTGKSRDSLDVTHSASPDEHREFINGLIDAGQVDVTINFDPDEDPPYNDPEEIVITYPNGATSTFTGFLISNSESISIADKMTQDVSIKVSGKPVHAAAA